MSATPGSTQPTDEGARQPHRRRPRYRGTHPRRFAEKYKEQDPAAFPGMDAHIRAQGRTPAGMHVPVLLNEVMEALKPAAGETVADCTLGYGGHAAAFMERIGNTGRLAGFDRDGDERASTAARLATTGVPLVIVPGNFAGLARAMERDHLPPFDIIFADLGVSSMQLDDPARGFSYKHDGPLDMRMDRRQPATAADLLDRLSAEELAAALREFGDEKDAGRIAEAIVAARDREPLRRTAGLARLVLEAKGLDARTWRGEAGADATHPAARVFQALRILVNKELESLAQLLRDAPWCLAPGGRIGIITFHSGEDRLVRQAFDEGAARSYYSSVATEPVRPGRAEINGNPRAASARFRWAIHAQA